MLFKLVWSQHTELLFQRHQSSFLHTLELGRQLFSMGDEETQARLQEELAALQDEWEQLHGLLGHGVDVSDAVLKVASACLSLQLHSSPSHVIHTYRI